MAAFAVLGNSFKFLKPVFQYNLLAPLPVVSIGINQITARHRWRRKKHWNPIYRRARAAKILKVELPDYDERREAEKMTEEEIRTKLKEKGIVPPRPWMEKPIFISCTGGIFDAYVPPEGDGKMSIISKTGAKQKMEFLSKKGRSYMNLRKIRNFEEEFDVSTFAENGQEIYKEAHEALVRKDEDRLHELVTEHCYLDMMANVELKTIQWKFVESLEPPRVVYIRVTDIISKTNIFAQITVRMHTRQNLAVYDRFGRLMHGSEAMVKDVLEYVVFEKHLSNEYGSWRIHEKIIPNWMPPKDPVPKTYVKKKFQPPPPPTEVAKTTESIQVAEEVKEPSSEQKPMPALA